MLSSLNCLVHSYYILLSNKNHLQYSTLCVIAIYQSRADGAPWSCTGQSDRVPRLAVVTFGVSRYTRELFQLYTRGACSGPSRLVASGQNVNSAAKITRPATRFRPSGRARVPSCPVAIRPGFRATGNRVSGLRTDRPAARRARRGIRACGDED